MVNCNFIDWWKTCHQGSTHKTLQIKTLYFMFLAVTKQSDLNCGPNHPESSLNPVVPANVSVFPRSLNSPICPSCSSCHYGAFEWQLSWTISVTFTAVPVWRRKWKEKKKKNQGSPAAKREKWLHKIHTHRLRDDNVRNVNIPASDDGDQTTSDVRSTLRFALMSCSRSTLLDISLYHMIYACPGMYPHGASRNIYINICSILS